MPDGLVLSIQRFCLHDGPGIRTTVFLQGCPLRCWWCHNPESQPREPLVTVDAARCVRCGACAEVCPQASETEGGGLPFVTDRCTRCGACIAACPTAAREMAGGRRSVEAVMREILRDRAYYAESGGGATFSGGEPLLQPEFLTALLKACRSERIHTAVDTTGLAPWKHLAEVARSADLFLYDVKALDSDQHRRHTGVPNERILDNLARLAAAHPRIWVRVPVVPGVNDTVEQAAALGSLLSPLSSVERVDLLPYHPLGRDKARGDAASALSRRVEPPPRRLLEEMAEALRSAGIATHLAG